MRRIARPRRPSALPLCHTAQRPSCPIQNPLQNRMPRCCSAVSRPFSTTPTIFFPPPPQTTQIETADPSEADLPASLRSSSGFTSLQSYSDATDEPALINLNIPPEWTVAPKPAEVEDIDYVPATSIEGLEELAGARQWWEQEGHWDADKEYVGFGPRRKVHDPAILELCARRAVIEAVAVSQDANQSLSAKQSWRRGGRDELVMAAGVGVDVGDNGAATLTGDVTGLLENLQGEESEMYELGADEAREMLQAGDQSWKKVKITDPKFKFMITKRVLQLTGHVISDARRDKIYNAHSLLQILVKPPKAKKLAQDNEIQDILTNLPNVQVHQRRVTPIDKHTMVGRWKVITKELEKRGLPVTGSGKQDRSRERQWIMGGMK